MKLQTSSLSGSLALDVWRILLATAQSDLGCTGDSLAAVFDVLLLLSLSFLRFSCSRFWVSSSTCLVSSSQRSSRESIFCLKLESKQNIRQDSGSF